MAFDGSNVCAGFTLTLTNQTADGAFTWISCGYNMTNTQSFVFRDMDLNGSSDVVYSFATNTIAYSLTFDGCEISSHWDTIGPATTADTFQTNSIVTIRNTVIDYSGIYGPMSLWKCNDLVPDFDLDNVKINLNLGTSNTWRLLFPVAGYAGTEVIKAHRITVSGIGDMAQVVTPYSTLTNAVAGGAQVEYSDLIFSDDGVVTAWNQNDSISGGTVSASDLTVSDDLTVGDDTTLGDDATDITTLDGIFKIVDKSFRTADVFAERDLGGWFLFEGLVGVSDAGVVGNPANAATVQFRWESENSADGMLFNSSGDGNLTLWGILTLNEQSGEPANPADGQSVVWMSNGTGFGGDGDLCVKINANSVLSTNTLVDHEP